MKNKDLQEISLFLNTELQHGIDIYDWQEDANGLESEKAYLKLTSEGLKEGKVKSILEFKKLLNAKKNRDFHKKMWTEDLKYGRLGVQELWENEKPEEREIYEGIVFDCMKDIIKTTSRMQFIPIEGQEKTKDQFEAFTQIVFSNRNWFMDKLDIKLPADAHDCYICQEEFWVTGKYVKND